MHNPGRRLIGSARARRSACSKRRNMRQRWPQLDPAKRIAAHHRIVQQWCRRNGARAGQRHPGARPHAASDRAARRRRLQHVHVRVSHGGPPPRSPAAGQELLLDPRSGSVDQHLLVHERVDETTTRDRPTSCVSARRPGVRLLQVIVYITIGELSHRGLR